MKLIDSQAEWESYLRREYPGVAFADDQRNPPGVNAVAAGVMVGRFYTSRSPAYGVIFDQPRSCSGKA